MFGHNETVSSEEGVSGGTRTTLSPTTPEIPGSITNDVENSSKGSFHTSTARPPVSTTRASPPVPTSAAPPQSSTASPAAKVCNSLP